MIKKWTDLLPEDAYIRLCECRSTRADIKRLYRAKCRFYDMNKTSYEPEDVLISVLEHLDANNQFFDLPNDEFNSILDSNTRKAV